MIYGGRLIAAVLSIVIVIGACGCVNTDKNFKKIEAYLNEKYDADFSVRERTGDVWSSRTKSYVAVDSNGQEFKVRETGGTFTDNYCAILFDHDAQAELQACVGESYKAFVATRSAYLGKTDRYETADEYLKSRSAVNVVVYAIDEVDCNAVAGLLSDYNSGKSFVISTMIYVVDAATFDEVSSYQDHVWASKIRRCESFKLDRDNTMTNQSWEDS